MPCLKPTIADDVTVLASNQMPLLSEHLLRLDSKSRRQRFNGVVSQGFLQRYHKKYIAPGTVVIGYFAHGELRGAAELHAPDSEGLSVIAFSVEEIAQSRGVGSALFEKVIREARKKGYDRLQLTTNVDNERMMALARKFGVRMQSREGETHGALTLVDRAAVGEKGPVSRRFPKAA